MSTMLPRLSLATATAAAAAGHLFIATRGRRAGKLAALLMDPGKHHDTLWDPAEHDAAEDPKVVVRYQHGFRLDRLHHFDGHGMGIRPTLSMGKGSTTVWGGTDRDRFLRDFRPVPLEHHVRATREMEGVLEGLGHVFVSYECRVALAKSYYNHPASEVGPVARAHMVAGEFTWGTRVQAKSGVWHVVGVYRHRGAAEDRLKRVSGPARLVHREPGEGEWAEVV